MSRSLTDNLWIKWADKNPDWMKNLGPDLDKKAIKKDYRMMELHSKEVCKQKDLWKYPETEIFYRVSFYHLRHTKS